MNDAEKFVSQFLMSQGILEEYLEEVAKLNFSKVGFAIEAINRPLLWSSTKRRGKFWSEVDRELRGSIPKRLAEVFIDYQNLKIFINPYLEAMEKFQ